MAAEWRPSGGRVAAEWRSSGGRVAVKYRPGIGRHVCRLVSVDMSTESRPTYRPSVGQYIGGDSANISAESIDRYSVNRCLKYT